MKLKFLYDVLSDIFRVLKNNQLIGPIPSTLSQIPNLKILYVQIHVLFLLFVIKGRLHARNN